MLQFVEIAQATTVANWLAIGVQLPETACESHRVTSWRTTLDRRAERDIMAYDIGPAGGA